MKYFAKYLPVDGEIKEGDTFLGSNGKIYQRNEGQEGWQSKLARKVKLFICCRNIAVGDIATNSQGAEIPWSSEMEQMFIDKVILKDGLFKVIGEISPEAIYVKEGDEFEEKEVKIHFRDVYVGVESYFDTEFQEESTRGSYKRVDTAYIKGPCGHFH